MLSGPLQVEVRKSPCKIVDDTEVVFPTADEKTYETRFTAILLQVSRRNRNVVICTVDVADLNGFTATRYQRKLLPRRESDYSVLDMD